MSDTGETNGLTDLLPLDKGQAQLESPIGALMPFSFDVDPRTGQRVAGGGFHLATPSLVRGAINAVGHMEQAGRAIEGTGPGITPAGAQQVAGEATAGMMGLGLGAPVEGETFRTFGGPKSKFYDPEKAKLAADMNDEGYGGHDIWRTTGYFRDKDGFWKHEIPDTGAKLHIQPWGTTSGGASKPINLSHFLSEDQAKEGVNLQDIAEIPAFQAYPELRNIKVMPVPPGAGQSGDIVRKNDGTFVMRLAPLMPADMMRTILHETQHAVQDTEGFGRGGSTRMFLPPTFDAEQKFANDTFYNAHNDAVQRGLWQTPADSGELTEGMRRIKVGNTPSAWQQMLIQKVAEHPDIYRQFEEASNQFDALTSKRRDAWNKYQSLSGEVEARNVEERWAQGDTTSHPHETTGYHQGQQLVRRGYNMQPYLVNNEPWYVHPLGETDLGDPGPSESFKGFHGTPHTFEPTDTNPFGEFKDEKIGTGEGAQVYGHGHYVAGNRQVAEEYKNNLSNKIFSLNGKDLDPNANEADAHIYSALNNSGFHPEHKNPDEFLDMAKEDLKQQILDTKHTVNTTQRRIDAGYASPYDLDLFKQHLQTLQDAWGKLKDAKAEDIGQKQGGNLLHLEIKPDEHELLDWEKPLSQQHPKIQAAIEPLIRQLHNSDVSPVWLNAAEGSGGGLYHALEQMNAGEDNAGVLASRMLHEAGVPGIKYLDQFSRDKTGIANDTRLARFPSGKYELRAYGPGGQKFTHDSIHDEMTEDQVKQTIGPEAFDALMADLNHPNNAGQPVPRAQTTMPVHFKGTSNYVIFDPKNIRIVGRNGESLQMEPVDHDPFAKGGKK